MTSGQFFDLDYVREQAVAATGGLSDFGAPDYLEGLRILLDSYQRTARLSDAGKAQMAGAVIGDLAGRLHEEAGYARFPELLDTPIHAPIIVTGIPRSGTTVFHRLLSLDPATQSMPMWLACNPMPRPARDSWASNPFHRQVEQGLEAFAQLSSDVLTLHPQHADAADECRILINHSFTAPSLPITTHIPDYERWVLAQDMVPAYRRHRKTLGLIGAGSRKRWVLKCPSHIGALEALLDVYPDACVVITHRDPIKAMPSLLGLVRSVRRHIEDGFDAHRFGRENLDVQGRSLFRMEEARTRIDESRIFDVLCDETWADPLGTLERIYDHFGLEVSDAARAAWRSQVDDDPSGGHAAQHATPADFGLSEADVAEAAGPYLDRYRKVQRAYSERKRATGETITPRNTETQDFA